MAKPEWGQKRTCNSCGCRFYDMSRSPITCPKCGSTVEPDLPFKVRRSSSAQAEKAADKILGRPSLAPAAVRQASDARIKAYAAGRAEE